MKCKHCGAPMRQGDTACAYCGAVFETSQPMVVKIYNQEKQAEKPPERPLNSSAKIRELNRLPLSVHSARTFHSPSLIKTISILQILQRNIIRQHKEKNIQEKGEGEILMKDTNLNVNEYLPLRDVVFNTLRQAIITGEFAPGERLMEISLANRLGVSRTPVREAIRKLELEGLVIMIPRKGAQVAKITEKNLRDVIEIRTVLEEFATVLACERITQDGVLKLRQAHEDFIHAVEKGDILDIANKDETFHDTIFQATNNDRLISIINNLREQFYRYRMEYVKDIRQRSNLVEEHRELLDAISTRDTVKAKQLMRAHILKQQQEVINNIQEA